MRNRGELFSSLLLVAFGVGYLVYAGEYSRGSAADPGPGFLPFAISLLIIALAARLVLGALLAKPAAAKGAAAAAAGDEGEEKSHRMAIFMALALVVYIAILERAGYLLSTFFLLMAGMRIMGERSWFKSLVIALGLVAFTYFLFIAWLQVPLPKGQILPFGGR